MIDRSLHDNVALVTGATSGIGAACAAAFAEAGADVCLGYHGELEAAAPGCARVEAVGGKALGVALDVGDAASVEAAFDRCAAALGVPDILLNAAGLNMSAVSVSDMSLDQWNRVLQVDLTGTFLTARRFVRDLKAAGRKGAIINVTSIHAFAMRAGGADYCAAKGAQANLTRTLALETAAHGITVNAIAPGMILTPMNARAMADAEYRASLEQHIPMGRAGTAEEVAGVALFLASPAAHYITGATIVIDGGLSLVQAPGA